MSIKQVRISGRQQVEARIHDFLNKQINLVLRDNTAILGTVEQIKNDSIIIRNQQARKVALSLDMIYEIFFDIDV